MIQQHRIYEIILDQAPLETDESLRAWAQLDVDRGARASGPLDFLSLPSAEELLSPETVTPEAVNPENRTPAAPRPPDDED